MKKCYSCKETKDTAEFHKHKNEIGGFKNHCKECCKIRRRIYYQKNKSKELKSSQNYKAIHAINLAAQSKIYRKKNPLKVKAWKRREYDRDMADPEKRLQRILGTKIGKMLKYRKSSKTIKELLGYGFGDLVVHLEKYFQNGMSWDNYGKLWHVDHIVPKSWFGTSDEEVKECWRLENLQPLWKGENLSKGNRYSSKPLS